MNAALRQRIRQQAHFRCEYCQIREEDLPFAPFHLDHVIASQHGGSDLPENLAWSCHECNLFKGPNLSSIDPDTRQVVTLFNPRTDLWNVHFQIDGNYIRGLTSTGRATSWLLQFNSPERLSLRTLLSK